MKVAVLDHQMGNLRSVGKTLEAAGASVDVTDDLGVIDGADALCVPGQGIYGRCVDNLVQRGGDDLIRSWVQAERPLLGICLGMQILFDCSEEGDHKGLGIIPGEVRRLRGDVTVPHIGWNDVDDTFYYFDHSFAAFPASDDVVTGWCTHGPRFAARVEAGSILGVQFHPEKSGSDGISLLEEWIGHR